jgi:hypothetical protein
MLVYVNLGIGEFVSLGGPLAVLLQTLISKI